MSVGEICNREVVIMSRRESILDAARMMREQHVGDVVIVDEKEGKRIPVGILTLDDFLEIISEQLTDLVGLLTTELRHERELRSD